MEERKRILVVEDESINRRILKKLLAEEYDILEAENGQAGWALLEQNRRSLAAVLLDMVMPVMDGYAFLEKLRVAGITDLPVIVTTGDTEGEQTVLTAGAWDFVTKPYNAKVLLSRLRNAIARSEVELYRQMQKMAAHDPLTGLHNRARMFQQTRQMLDEHPEQRFAFLRFDIDHFALYNTSFGEAEGDRLLCYMARCLRELTDMEEYCTFGRMNSDVFCVCVPFNGDEDHVRRQVGYLQEKLSAYKKDYLLVLSAGVYIVNDRSMNVEDLYFRATVAAKNCKNQYETHVAFYDDAAGKQLAVAISIENEMQSALEEEQFLVYLQPKFQVSTEKICGAEALVRWKHPTKGMISPGEFIPVFENNGFISKLDYYVWEKTCAMLRKWMDEGKPLYPISVNISRVSLYNPNLCALFIGLIEKYRIPAPLLQLEITESAYMSDPDLMESIIRSLHEAGFTILMDDFGSGYSSLNTLKRIYIDVLKIDMQFLPVENETERGEIILACIIRMANLLGMSVVTEGVETRRQRDFLESAGCDSIQGFYYSRPIPQEEFERVYLSAPEEPEPEDEELHPHSVDPVQTQSGSGPKQNVTILVIDDSEMEREILKENLKDMYHVHLCDSAESGLAYLKTNISRVRLILVDNHMPGMSGIDFLKYCRVDSALNAIPKIMITAEDTVGDHVEAFKAGAYDYIAKPLIKEVLLARVSHAMSLSSQTFLFTSFEDDYKRFSERDPATGLLNKMAFRELSVRLMQATEGSSNSLILLDVDDFKGINEQYGRPAGDKVLKAVATELKNGFRKTDVIGRLGAAKLAVLMTQIPNQEVARRKAAEITRAVGYACGTHLSIPATVSIGIAFSGGEDSTESLYARASHALYEAKSYGKSTVAVFGEKVPPIRDDQPVVLVCSDDAQLYPMMALAYGNSVGFTRISDFPQLRAAFDAYGARIRAVCLDMQKSLAPDTQEFTNCLRAHSCGDKIPLLAFCKEGNIRQMRDALALGVTDLLALPPQIDSIQQRLSAALLRNGPLS